MSINCSREQNRLATTELLIKGCKSDPIELERLIQVKAAQTAALISKEQSYPQRLARHLRKCKKFGWTDGRLAKKK